MECRPRRVLGLGGALRGGLYDGILYGTLLLRYLIVVVQCVVVSLGGGLRGVGVCVLAVLLCLDCRRAWGDCVSVVGVGIFVTVVEVVALYSGASKSSFRCFGPGRVFVSGGVGFTVGSVWL